MKQLCTGQYACILLNSHLDTVKPNEQYVGDPFTPVIRDGKLYGLGSNDAGGPLVALVSSFLYFNVQQNLPFNLCLAATAEEENSGPHGITCILIDLMPIAFAIVGEPTGMEITGTYLSPTSSDQGWLNMPSIKMGPGNSARSHTADEFIYLQEITEGISIYINLLESLFPYLANDPELSLHAYEAQQEH